MIFNLILGIISSSINQLLVLLQMVSRYGTKIHFTPEAAKGTQFSIANDRRDLCVLIWYCVSDQGCNVFMLNIQVMSNMIQFFKSLLNHIQSPNKDYLVDTLRL